jgi:hypothetical protein
MYTAIQAYHHSLPTDEQAIADMLFHEINRRLPQAENKLWHGHPVWFLDGNPIVGYSLRKCGLNLMFWSGQSFDEPDLKKEGKFKAAEICYTTASQVDTASLKRWLEKAQTIQWDYKNIVKRKGQLERLK